MYGPIHIPCRLLGLLKLQKKIVRICSMSHYTAPSQPLFKKINLLTIYQLNDYCISLMVFKHKHNKLPYNIASIIKCKTEMHNYITRNPENYYVEKCKNTASSFSFKSKGSSTWNSLLHYVKTILFLNSFKSKLKVFFYSHTLQNN